MNTALEYSTRVVQEGDRRCKKSTLKGIDRPFGGGVERVQYTHSIHTDKLEARIFFLSYFKGPSSQDQQKTCRRR